MEEPALPVGTEVSAKYRGAFCEAKVKKVVRAIKIKVTLKESGLPLVVTACSDEDVKGTLKIGSSVEVKHPESGQYVGATICKLTDQSSYTVVFDDADENTLRRTQLCLKGEKHFVKTDTLDELPLTNPEHFGTPVVKSTKKKRRSATANASSDSDSGADSDESEPRQYLGRLREMVGKVVCFQQEDRKKTMTLPALVTQPDADETDLTKDHLLVKSFKDSKFYAVHKKEARDFTRDIALKNDDKALKPVYEKALLYYDAKELPQQWDKEELLGTESDSDDDELQSSDNEPSEEKDMFVAQLYKFMDDRATPINKGPVIGTRDLNLYRLFGVVHKLGGYNRVTNQMKWRLVYSKMGLPNTANAANQMKTAYNKYLHPYEDFYRKLGSSMGTITRPNRNRITSSRNIPGFRDRGDRGESSPRSPRASHSAAASPAIASSSASAGSVSTSVGMKKSLKEEPLDELPHTDVPDVTKTPQESKSNKSKLDESVHSKGVEEPSDSESPGKRRTRTAMEEKSKILKEAKKPIVREEEESSEKDEVKGKRRPIRKKLTKTEEAERDEVKKPGKEECKEDADDEEEEEEEDDTKSNKTTASDDLNSVKKYENVEYPPDSKLKIKYGKGKNVKAYEAKVLDCKADQGSMHYLVHYNGWNVRYDEWVKKDRILECLFKADSKRPLTLTKHTIPANKVQPIKKNIPTPKQSGPVLKDEKDKLSKSASPKMSKSNKPPRPTRSTSLENQLAIGLSPRKRLRKLSGYTETSEGKSNMSDESSSSEEEDEEETEDQHQFPDNRPASPAISQKQSPAGDDCDRVTDNRESAFDIIKELQADMDFDKASQDSLERDLNIKIPDKTKQEKSDSDEDMDINSILSCLKDEYKFPSSESESVKSEGPEKRVVRGKTKTKGELKAKPDLSKILKPDAVKARTDSKPSCVDMTKTKADPVKISPEQAKVKNEPLKPKVDLSKARVEPSRSKIEPTVTKTKPESATSKKDAVKVKAEPNVGKSKQDSQKSKVVEEEQPTVEGYISEKAHVLSAPQAPDLSQSMDLAKTKMEKTISSGDEQLVLSERLKGRRKKDVEDDKVEKCESPSKLRGKGRGKRRIDKDETPDSEEEPMKKKTRKKSKRQTESESDDKSLPPKLSTVTSDDVQEDAAAPTDTKEEENEWMNAPELTATPKLELEDIDDEDCDGADQPAPSLSPVHLRSSAAAALTALSGITATGFMEEESKALMEEAEEEEEDRDDEEETVELPKAFTSTVENTPPQTPEHPSASNTPHHENTSEACSTHSELEANLEVEGYLVGARPPGEESPGAGLTGGVGEIYDPSNVSIASDESLNQDKLGEVEASVAASLGMQALVKRKAEESVAAAAAAVTTQKRRRGNKKSGGNSGVHKVKLSDGISSRRTVSDYDDEDSKDAIVPSKSSIVSNLCSFPALSKPIEFPTGPTKYNFIEQLEEGKYLTGESRVNFLLGKISDLRSIYLQLKAEVASIDRRRKKFRKKQRIAQETAAQGLIGLEQSVS